MEDNLKVISHRCDGSLKEEMSIRYCVEFRGNESNWWLLQSAYIESWNGMRLNFITKIKHCPYCGISLKGVRNG